MTQSPRQIVVGTDGSATADEAVRRAGEAARLSGARLHIVTVLTGPTAPDAHLPDELRWAETPGRRADEVLRTAAGLVDGGLDVALHSREGDPADVLVDLANQVGADLLVVGNKGMGGMGGFVRPTVPNRVSHRASCDVLIVATERRAA